MEDSAVVCTLTAVEQSRQRQELLPGLVRRADLIEWREDGCRLKFAPDSELLRQITAVMDAERQCCQFLRFELVIELRLGPVSLTLTGPAGTADMLRSLLSVI
jgi:hypothetical protein